jgi:D-sedoheptulose 7-phosphate isomerase
MSTGGAAAKDAPLAQIRLRLQESARVTDATGAEAAEAICAAAERVIEAFRGGHKLLTFGNGGSAADAQHLASELAGRFGAAERPALPALALTANSSDLTAIGNDYGFEQIFPRLIEAHGRAGDVAVALSTSGNSPNVLAGVAAARARGLETIALTGRGGGKLAGLVDVAVIVPADDTARIQEAHIAVCHVLCELVEATLFPERAAP